MHPEVARRFGELVEEHRETAGVVVYVTPLLVELGLAPAFDVVVVVTASPTCGCRAWRRTEGSRPTTSGARMATQASDEQRAEVANVLIDNDGTLAELERQVERPVAGRT